MNDFSLLAFDFIALTADKISSSYANATLTVCEALKELKRFLNFHGKTFVIAFNHLEYENNNFMPIL